MVIVGRLILLWIPLMSGALVVGCATAHLSSRPNSGDPNAVIRQALIQGDLALVSREILRVQGQGVEPELLAQYHLYNCQPQSALVAIQEIQNQQERELYEAVLAALISVERPTEQAGQTSSGGQTNPSSSVASQEKYAVDSGEIWRDEWEDLSFSRLGCESMPVASNPEDRSRFQQAARERFERLPVQIYHRHFSVVALALDVGVHPPDPSELLKRYEGHSSDPYYARLQELDPSEAVQDQVTVTRSKSDEIQLTGLVLKKLETTAAGVRVPQLIQARPSQGSAL